MFNNIGPSLLCLVPATSTCFSECFFAVASNSTQQPIYIRCQCLDLGLQPIDHSAKASKVCPFCGWFYKKNFANVSVPYSVNIKLVKCIIQLIF